MLSNDDFKSIENLLSDKKIIHSELLSDSFNINCVKLKTSDNKFLIAKYYKTKNKEFNAIKSEKNNLLFLSKLNLNIFPNIYKCNNDYILISYINNNGKQPNETRIDLIDAIISIHSFNNDLYGLDFDSQIGGLKQKNTKCNNWVDFYREYRIGYIFELINKKYPMDSSINSKINFIINNLENYIQKNPTPSLLHGDLWEGNILFNDFNFVGFIDPGSYYGHNELEIAYLRWFNPKFIDDTFLSKYNNFINIHEDYLKYEPIYQLYYSLLNVYLWDREYIKDVKRLLNKIRI